MADVYSAGEEPIVGADSRSLMRAIRLRGEIDHVFFTPELEEMKETLGKQTRDGDVVLVMGAGSIGRLPEQLVDKDE